MGRFVTLTLPARIVIDGVGGGDVVFRELTLGEYLDTDGADKVSLALHSFRGSALPSGAAREEWIRALPSAAGVQFAKAVVRIGNPTDEQFKAFEKSRAPRAGGGAVWKLPADLGGALVEVRELTFGQVEDAQATVRAAKGRSATFALVAAATGRTERELRDMPSPAGTLVLLAYKEIHTTTDEEDESFFGGAQTSTAPPKTV